MKRSRFIVVTMVVLLSIVALVAVEALWAVRNYRELRTNYKHQIESILDEASQQYAVASIDGGSLISMGGIDRFHAIVAEELRTSGIESQFKVEVLSTTDNEPLSLMSYGNDNLGEGCMVAERCNTPLILRLTVEDPHARIMESMRSILILQALSILLIIIAFIYLILTLFRAKSIDKIRSDLTSNITHELKTPIAAALAATDAMMTTPRIAENRALREEYIQMTHDELKRLESLVEHILRSSTEQMDSAQLHMQECDIADVIRDVVHSHKLKYSQRDICWSIDVEDEAMVVADSFHLKNIVGALVDNAIKYSPEPCKIAIRGLMREEYTYISVADNGVGIPRREQRRIFDKFYRITDGARHDTKGYGIGLYYVRSIVRRHGGRITVASSHGKGACFTIKLPRYGKQTYIDS